MKFLLERYLYNFKFKRHKYIKDVNKMKRDYKHYFVINKRIIEEKTYLNNYFEKVKRIQFRKCYNFKQIRLTKQVICGKIYKCVGLNLQPRTKGFK